MIRSSVLHKVLNGRQWIRPMARTETLDRQEAKHLLDRQARKYLDMSGKDFKERYRAGTLEDAHTPRVIRVASLIPFSEE
jgi:hypothetical protein